MTKTKTTQQTLDLGEITTLRSLTVPDDTTFDQFEDLVTRVLTMHDSSTWWAGDLAIAGERLFGDDAAQAFPGAQWLAEKTILNRRRVCEEFPPAKRTFDVSFSHYAEVVSLAAKDRTRLLRRCQTEGLGVSELRRMVRELKRSRSGQDELDLDDPTPSYANALRVVLEIEPTIALGLVEDRRALVSWCHNVEEADTEFEPAETS